MRLRDAYAHRLRQVVTSFAIGACPIQRDGQLERADERFSRHAEGITRALDNLLAEF